MARFGNEVGSDESSRNKRISHALTLPSTHVRSDDISDLNDTCDAVPAVAAGTADAK
jgi:hypothetical protein